eukprot:jgi/Psemu1/311999/fgenesh1_kg.866_\
MERRDQAQKQRMKGVATPIAQIRMQPLACAKNIDASIRKENMIQRTPIQGMLASETLPITTELARQAVGMGMIGHIPGLVGFNLSQRDVLSQEQVIHYSRIKQIMNIANNSDANQARSIDASSLVLSNLGERNPAKRSIQLEDIYRGIILCNNRSSIEQYLFSHIDPGNKSECRLPRATDAGSSSR